MDNYIPINFTYYDPRNSLFKSGRSDREETTVYMCNNSENCDAFKRGKCIMLNGFYHSCPYGRTYKDKGYTKAAKNCGVLIRKNKEKYGNVAYSKGDLRFICKIGDYIYIPLPHLSNYVNPIKDKEFFVGNYDMIRVSDFTPEFIIELLKFKPQALFGGEITSYQREHIPKFCSQLKRYMPDMFEKVKMVYPEIESKIQSIDYRGKYAKVKTLLPGKIKLSTDIVEWDGTVIKAEGNQISFWRLNKVPVTIMPNEDTYVEIVDNNTVTEETEFRDE